MQNEKFLEFFSMRLLSHYALEDVKCLSVDLESATEVEFRVEDPFHVDGNCAKRRKREIVWKSKKNQSFKSY